MVWWLTGVCKSVEGEATSLVDTSSAADEADVGAGALEVPAVESNLALLMWLASGGVAADDVDMTLLDV